MAERGIPLDVPERGARLRSGLLIGALGALAALALSLAPSGRAIERAILDIHLRRGDVAGADDIVVMQVDNLDVEALDRRGIPWPWPLDVNAALVSTLWKAGAQALVVDILHLDRGAGTADRAEGSFDHLEADARAGLEQRLALEQMSAEPYRDALREFGSRAVVAFELASGAEYDVLARREIAAARLPNLDGSLPGAPYRRPYARWPVVRVAEGAGALGFSNVDPDEDGIVRRSAGLGLWGERVVPSLALAACAAAEGVQPRREGDGVALGGRFVRLDRDGAFHVPIVRPNDRSPFRAVAVRDAIAWAEQAMADPSGEPPRAARDAVGGCVVVVGVNLAGLRDVVTTAAGLIDGPEFVAHTLKAWRTDTGRVRVSSLANLLFALGCSLGLGVLLGLFPSWRIGILATLFAIAASQAVVALGHARGHVISAALPATALILTGLGHGGLAFVRRSRANRWLQNSFGRYLAPTVIDALRRDPSLIRLGGRRRRLTLLFSDLAGFTSMARRLEPDQVVDLLNRYLSMHAGAVLAEGGVVDKFIGDAVMAFWGDPIEQPDQAERACRTALRVLHGMPAVEVAARALGLSGFRVRIGIHTGDAVVGNMGSDDRQDYTCMGDTVNLASRLEGANKAFGTTCLLGEATYREARDAIEARHVADVVVVGHDVPLPVYELVGPKGDVGARDRVERFDEAMRLLREDRRPEARAALHALCEVAPEDGAAAWLLGIVDDLDAGRRAAPWDAVVVLDAK